MSEKKKCFCGKEATHHYFPNIDSKKMTNVCPEHARRAEEKGFVVWKIGE